MATSQTLCIIHTHTHRHLHNHTNLYIIETIVSRKEYIEYIFLNLGI